MKRSNFAARLLVATLTIVTLVTLDRVTLAATTGDSPDAIPMEAVATRNTPAKHEQETAITHSPLTLLVQSPGGSTLRLTYIQDDGWTVDDRDASLEQTEGRVTPAAVSKPKEDAVANHPLTVFIDGPSGYTYVWIRDQGWKFVGHITDRTK
jgi:hypothetical protein